MFLWQMDSSLRRSYQVLCVAILLTSCGQGTVPIANEEPGSDTMIGKTVPPPPGLINALVGTWMPTNYCDCLFAKRSAYACGEDLDYIYTMFVERHGKDSLRWSYVTTHEGGPEAILGYDAARSTFAHLPAAEEHLGHAMVELRSLDPTTLECRDDKNKPSQRFRRVANTEALLNEALFQGVYIDLDRQDTVRFTADGAMDGLPGLDHFNVLTDFTEGLDDRDIVFLSMGDDYDWNTDSYHYKRDGDTLLLCPMLATDTEYVYRMGDVKYRLLSVPE